MTMEYPRQPYALGQVVVMMFEEPPAPFSLLGDSMTVLISKPEFPIQYLQFPGGMLNPGESFAAAAHREPQEETGVVVSQDPLDLIEFCRLPKPRHAPYPGTFDVAFFGAFNCDFSRRLRPREGQTGNDGEESQLVRFRDITTPRFTWRLENLPLFQVAMFPPNLELLETAARNQRIAMQSNN